MADEIDLDEVKVFATRALVLEQYGIGGVQRWKS